MAIEFVKGINESELLSAYNVYRVKFKSNTPDKTAIGAKVELSGFEYDLTPDTSEEFNLPFVKVFAVLANQNHFRDEVDPDLTAETVNNDSTLYHEFTVTYRIIFSDETEETDSKTYKVLKSVKQIIRDTVSEDARLFPLVARSSSSPQLTYFEGYPYDIPLFSDDTRQVTVKNNTTGNDTTIDLTKGVNRFLVSDGVNSIATENILPLVTGFNELEFYISGTLIFTIFLRKVESCDGSYLKFFNKNGTYSYWLLTGYNSLETKTRTIDTIKTDFDGIDETTGNFTITGKTASKELQTISQLLTQQEFDYLSEIYTSPLVQVYNRDKYSQADLDSWVDVKVQDGRFSDKSKHHVQQLPIAIQLPNQYTQTL